MGRGREFFPYENFENGRKKKLNGIISCDSLRACIREEITEYLLYVNISRANQFFFFVLFNNRKYYINGIQFPVRVVRSVSCVYDPKRARVHIGVSPIIYVFNSIFFSQYSVVYYILFLIFSPHQKIRLPR